MYNFIGTVDIKKIKIWKYVINKWEYYNRCTCFISFQGYTYFSCYLLGIRIKMTKMLSGFKNIRMPQKQILRRKMARADLPQEYIYTYLGLLHWGCHTRHQCYSTSYLLSPVTRAFQSQIWIIFASMGVIISFDPILDLFLFFFSFSFWWSCIYLTLVIALKKDVAMFLNLQQEKILILLLLHGIERK